MIPYLVPNTFDMSRLKDSTGAYLFTSNNLALYVQGPNVVPDNNSIGVLADAISCQTTHRINGEDELLMTYPINGALFDEIKLRCVIVANVERTRGNQPFRIYRITKPLNGIVTIYARHLAYDLSGIVVEPFSASTITGALAGLKSHAMTNNPFTFTTSRGTAAAFRVTVPTSAWDLMGGQQGSLLDVYGGEYLFDGYNISLENRIGADNGVSVRYGKNMTDLEQDANCADCYTGVVAYWQGEDEVVYSPVVAAAGSYGYVKVMSVDMSDKWEERPTVEELKTAASAYITENNIGVPVVSWTVGFISLDMTEEYKDTAILERVSLGDTVRVEFAKLGVDASARVNCIEWDVLLDRYITVSLGDVRQNIADTIAAQGREIAKAPTTAEVKSMAERISTTLTAAILGANGGSVRLLDTDNDGEPDTLYIADNPDPAQAVKVWRWNYEGWGASSNGYNGPFTMGATLDGGIMADFITAGVLNADLIQTGTMSADRILGGALRIGNVNGTTGRIDVYDANGAYCGSFANFGIALRGNGNEGFFYPNGVQFGRYINNTFYPLAKFSLYSSGNTSYGLVELYYMADENNPSTERRVIIGGDGVVRCTALYINGQPVTP